ncbi:VWA domain-containing protein [bacterium]|jgi:hypothetical protein|nr:VWA domain-containing protein [bacterium]
MNKNLCELVVILDESGSMNSVLNDTIGGFNTFIETHQALPGEANLTLVKFNSSSEIVYNGVNIQNVPKLDNHTYQPGGMTALLDAVGKSIDEVGKRLANIPEEDRPGKVIFMIVTDGEENSSREYKIDKIKEKIIHQTDVYKWEFVFMGADQDAWTTGTRMGTSNNVNFNSNDMSKTMKGMAYYSSNSRGYCTNTSLANFDLTETELDNEIQKIKNKK